MRLSYALRLPSDLRYVSVVRHLCVNTLAELGVTEDCVDDIALAVTEACANVVQHAGGVDAFEVGIGVEGMLCRIEVIDTGRSGEPTDTGGADPPPSLSEEVGDLLTHGRGLDLMRILVDQLHFSPGTEGTTVVLVKELALTAGSVLDDPALAGPEVGGTPISRGRRPA